MDAKPVLFPIHLAKEIQFMRSQERACDGNKERSDYKKGRRNGIS